ncbi:hypothetical protein BHS06_34220 [Myxococcus xanthus]|nr:hypothetical protein BHS06_34220 [Myxococcus xanthus]
MWKFIATAGPLPDASCLFLNMRMALAAENPVLPKVRLGGGRGGGGALRSTAVFLLKPARGGPPTLVCQRNEALTERLRASEAEQTMLLDAITALVSFISADERYGRVNKAHEERVRAFAGDARTPVGGIGQPPTDLGTTRWRR